MFRVQRRVGSRLSTGLALTGLLAAGVIVTAASASADEQNSGGGATATLGGLATSATAVIHGDHGDKKVSAGLFSLDVDGGGSLQTYCIDIFNPTQTKARYQETAWEQSSLHDNKDAGKIRWILQNSYPQVNDLAKLASDSGAGVLSDKQAAAGTQVAIWRFSDHVKVDAEDKAAQTLANYLVDNARTLEEPKASLTVSPAAVSGKAGEKLGPVTINTSAANATVELDAASAASNKVRVVNKDGKPVTSAVNGTQLFFSVPADAGAGTATLSLKASTTVPVGRAFTGVGQNKGSQTQILAGSSASTVAATATATWAEREHQGPLPAITTENNCTKGGVDIHVANQGDEDFVFTLAGKKHTISAGKTETVFWPVDEDQPYEIKIAMPDGTDKVFKGVLDCKTGSGSTGGSQPSSHPSPASVGGSTSGGDGNLAETGSSNSTPLIAGLAIAFVVVGGGAVFFVRRRKSTAGD